MSVAIMEGSVTPAPPRASTHRLPQSGPEKGSEPFARFLGEGPGPGPRGPYVLSGDGTNGRAQPNHEANPPTADVGVSPAADQPSAAGTDPTTGADPTVDTEALVADPSAAGETPPAAPNPDGTEQIEPPTADRQSRPHLEPDNALDRAFEHWTHAHAKRRGPETEGKTLHVPTAFKGLASPEQTTQSDDDPHDKTDSTDPVTVTPVAVALAPTTTVTQPTDEAAATTNAPIAVDTAAGGKLPPTPTLQATDPDAPAQSAAPADVAAEQAPQNLTADAAKQQPGDLPVHITGLRALAGERDPALQTASTDLQQSADGTPTDEPAQTVAQADPDARIHQRPTASGLHQSAGDARHSIRAGGDLALHLQTDASMTDPGSAGHSTADAPTQLAQPTHPLHLVNRMHSATPAPAQSPVTAANTPVPIAGLAVEIAARAQAGRHRFEIRLDPPELGRIDVRLDIDHGHATSRLVVDRAETLDLLRRDASDLQRALQQAGLKTSDNGLQFALRDQGQANYGQTNRQPAEMTRVVVPDTNAVAEPAPATYAHALLRIDGIDIRV